MEKIKEFFNKCSEFITKYLKIEHFVTIVICLLVLILISIIARALFNAKVKKLERLVSSEDNSYHVYINLNQKTVLVFSKLNLDNPAEYSLGNYLQLFDESNQEELNRWLFALMNVKLVCPKHLELFNYNKKTRTYYRDLFVCREVETKELILHLDYFSYNLHSTKKRRNRECPYIKTQLEIERLFFRNKKNAATTIGLISFFPTSVFNQTKEYNLDIFIKHQLIFLLIPYLNENHLISLLPDGRIAIIILNYDVDSEHYIENISQVLSRFYQVNSMSQESFNICVKKAITGEINYPEVLNNLSTLSLFQIDKKNYSEFVFIYDHNIDYTPIEEKKRSLDIHDSIDNELFDFSFNAIISSKNTLIDGYNVVILSRLESLKDKDYFFKSLYREKLGPAYLKMVVEKINNVFNDENNIKGRKTIRSACIKFSPILIKDLVSQKALFENYPDIQFFISMNLSDIISTYENEPSLFEDIAKVKSKNVSLRLNIDTTQPILDQISQYFASYSIGNKFFIASLKDSIKSVILSNTLAELGNKGTYINAFDVEDWNTLETFITNKVFYLSGRIIDDSKEINPTIPRRVTDKIRATQNKYYK